MTKKIKKLKEQVEYCLKIFPQTRNSDITLMIRVWKDFYNDKINYDKHGASFVYLEKLYFLPRQDAISRVRRQIQNDERKYPPTEWEIAKARGYLETEWKIALGYYNRKINERQQSIFANCG